MNIERDKFLTEAMGECWHEVLGGQWNCYKCRNENTLNYDFSTWEGFGKLLEKARDNQGVGIIVAQNILAKVIEKSMNNIPDRFANAVYEFLKERY